MYLLCCQILYHHGISMIVPRFTFFTENFVICCDQVTKMFRSGHDCTRTSSARSHGNFGSQAEIEIWVRWKVRKRCYAYTIPLLLAALKVVHEKNWKHLGVQEHFHLPDCLELFWPFWQIMRRVSAYFLTHTHLLLVRDALWELRLPAMKM